MERRLAAILAADVVGYSRLMGEDEAGTLARLKTHRQELIDPKVAEHHGRIVKLMGDGALVEFASVVDAVHCAAEIQRAMAERNAGVLQDCRIEFRIGINLGDVIAEGEDIYGDGVNIADRLQGLAEPGGIYVSGTAFDQVKNKLDVGFGFLGERQVKNIADPVRVYRVLMEPEAAGKVVDAMKPRLPRWRWAAAAGGLLALAAGGAVALWLRMWAPDVEPASVARMAFPLPEKPSIAVLPFDNLSGDPEQDHLTDGTTENIITLLSKVPELFVIARNSTFAYKGKPVKAQQVAEDLGVRYVLEGSVQRSGAQVRVTAQLVDAIQGRHLWAERYDREWADVFAIQDEIALDVVSALHVVLQEGEQAHLVGSRTRSVEAWELHLRGLVELRRFTKEGNAKARLLWQRALALDPDYGLAWVNVGWTYWLDVRFGYSDSREDSLRLADEAVERALAMDDTDADAYSLLGNIHLIKGEHDKAIAMGEKALGLNPNNSGNTAQLAMTMFFSGKPGQALELIRRAMRLDPNYPLWFLMPLEEAYRLTGHYDEAIETIKEELRRLDHFFTRTRLALYYAQSGRDEEARAEIARVLRANPEMNLQYWANAQYFKDPAQLERDLADLQRVGLPEHPPLPLPDKPSIAVLPFDNLSDDPKQAYFADGITEDLITDLSKISGLFVIARNSTFAYKGKQTAVNDVARELGVRYVLEGSVRRAGNQLRINTQLIDAVTGGHLWAERYDGTLADVFGLQDQITGRVVAALQVALTQKERDLLARSGTTSSEAYDHYLRGYDFFMRFTKDDNAEARAEFEMAISFDPKYARAQALLGWSHWMASISAWSASPKESFYLAKDLASKAIALDDGLPTAHWLLGKIHLWSGRHDEAIAELERAISLDPNAANGFGHYGDILVWSGRPADAIPILEKALRLSPNDQGWLLTLLGFAHLLMERFEDSVAALERALVRNPDYLWAHAMLAAAQSERGRNQEARSAVAEVLRVNPNFSLSFFETRAPFKVPEHRQRIVQALRKAGLPR